MIKTHVIRFFVAALLAGLFAACGGSGEETADQANLSVESKEVPSKTKDPAAESPAVGSLCLAHSVAVTQCFICDAALRDPNRLWCRGHNRYEDRCFECHPELRDADRLYCEEHGLYEDECFFCHPELKAQESSTSLELGEPVVASLGSDPLFCREHNVAEIECGICQPALADELLPGRGLKIRLPSKASEAKAAISTMLPQEGSAHGVVTAVGELRFNLNRLVRITPLTDGIIRRVYADLGHTVSKGDVLAELSSPRIAEAKAALLMAVAEEMVSAKALARERNLFEKDVTPAQDLFDAEARHTTARAGLQAAEQALLGLGFDKEALDRIVEEQEGGSVLLLVAPFDGTVTSRNAVVGDVVSVGDEVFSVADLQTLWLSMAVSEAEVVKLRVGQRVEVRSESIDRTVNGHITWVSSQLNETTRMAEVRAEIPNSDLLLRAGMFVDARIALGESASSFLVDRDAVHRFGGNPFVFVRLEVDLYELRRVEIGPQVNGYIAVTAGLKSDDLVANVQSYLLKSEFQKSRLGAGCVD
jgi:cobalt-zinc-cadmium efflux system membrane fusion protein